MWSVMIPQPRPATLCLGPSTHEQCVLLLGSLGRFLKRYGIDKIVAILRTYPQIKIGFRREFLLWLGWLT